MKDLTLLSLPISEQEYRKLPLISYSDLSSFVQKGFRSLTMEKFQNSGMSEGKILDILLTGDKNTIAENLAILEFDLPSDNIVAIIQNTIQALKLTKQPIPKSLTGTLPIAVTNQFHIQAKVLGYGQSWKPEILIKKIVDEGNIYFSFYLENKDKQIVDFSTFEKISDLIPELQLNPYTNDYIVCENEDIEFYDQLKFSLPDGEFKIKGMMDRIIVDHKNKTIQICDFKLTNEDEEEFEIRILKFNYDIQAMVYNYIIKEIIKEDSYYQDFTVLPFKFIVIDPDTNSPIVWQFPDLDVDERIITSYGYPRKSWKSLYKELEFYKSLPEPPRYSRRTMENNGCNEISILKNVYPF